MSSCGLAVVVRRNGATVRSGVNVDASEEVAKLKYRQEVQFDKMVKIYPTDKRCVPCERLHVFVIDKKVASICCFYIVFSTSSA